MPSVAADANSAKRLRGSDLNVCYDITQEEKQLMFTFYAQISAPQSVVGTFMTTLASLTRLSRRQIQVFSAADDWSNWAS